SPLRRHPCRRELPETRSSYRWGLSATSTAAALHPALRCGLRRWPIPPRPWRASRHRHLSPALSLRRYLPETAATPGSISPPVRFLRTLWIDPGIYLDWQ